MADSPYPDDVSSLAHELSERIAALCPHVPAGELADLTSRLALAEHAHATGVSLGDAELELEPAVTAGNRIVWLPGPSASAIVLPAGEEPPSAAETAAQLVARARRHATSVRGLATRGSAVVRQLGAALVSAYQTRPRVQ